MNSTIRKYSFLLGACLSFYSCIHGGGLAPEWVKDMFVPHVENGFPYRIMSPMDGTDQEKFPVIISLHGASGRGDNNKKNVREWNEHFVLDDIRQKYPCYVITPNVTRPYKVSDLEAIQKVIQALSDADMTKIYAVGHSMGGYGVYTFMDHDPDYFAACMSSSAKGSLLSDIEKVKHIPLWTFHGDVDTTIPIKPNQNLFKKMKKFGGNMKFTTLKKGGHGTGAAFVKMGYPDDFPQWESGTVTNWVGKSWDFSTEVSSETCDTETNFMKWMFSKSTANLSHQDELSDETGLPESSQEDESDQTVSNSGNSQVDVTDPSQDNSEGELVDATTGEGLGMVPVSLSFSSNHMTLETMEDTVIEYMDLSANDQNSSSIRWNVSRPASHGEVTLKAKGRTYEKFSYTPAENYSGEDEFQITIENSQGDRVDLSIVVNVWPINDIPEAKGQSMSSVSGNTIALEVSNWGYSDIESPELDSLQIVSMTGLGYLAVNGRVVALNEVLTGADLEKIKYHSGSMTEHALIGYRIYDGEDWSEIETLTIKVNDIDAPKLKSVQPRQDITMKGNRRLSITFDEAIDHLNLKKTSFVFSGPATAGVNITSIEGTGAGPYQIHTQTPFRGGLLILGVQGISDTVGNEMEWTEVGAWHVREPIRLTKEPKLIKGSQAGILFDTISKLESFDFEPEDAIVQMGNGILMPKKTGEVTIVARDENMNEKIIQITIRDVQKKRQQKKIKRVMKNAPLHLMSLPFYQETPQSATEPAFAKIMIEVMGEKGTVWEAYGYDGAAFVNLEVDNVHTRSGKAYWVDVKSDLLIDHEGPSPQLGETIPVDLQPGWNIIGNPYPYRISISDLYILQDGESLPMSSDAQSTIGHLLWSINDAGEYVITESLDPFEGAWVNNLSGQSQTLYFFAESEAVLQSKPLYVMEKFESEASTYPPNPPLAKAEEMTVVEKSPVVSPVVPSISSSPDVSSENSNKEELPSSAPQLSAGSGGGGCLLQ
jgi:predicted esterase